MPILFAAVELLVIVLLLMIGVLTKVLFRRPWTIDAVGPDDEYSAWQIVGWRASGRARVHVIHHLEAHGTLPSEATVGAAAMTL